MSFDDWLNKVDIYLYRRIGLGHEDVEDFLWYDNFKSGIEPEEAADEFLKEFGL